LSGANAPELRAVTPTTEIDGVTQAQTEAFEGRALVPNDKANPTSRVVAANLATWPGRAPNLILARASNLC